MGGSKEELKSLAREFYSSLFTSDPEVEGEFSRGFFPCLEEEQCHGLEAEVTIS